MNKLWYLTFVVSSFAIASVGPTILSETRVGPAIQVAVVVEPSSFSAATAMELSEAFLGAHPDCTLARYVIFTDAQDGRDYIGGVGLTDIDYPAWRDAYLSQNPNPHATAEMIRLGRRAGVRVRFEDGRIEKHTVSGGDPFDLKVESLTALLAGVGFRRAGVQPAGFPDRLVTLFVQTPEPWTRRQAEVFISRLRAEARFPWLQVDLENGSWFVGSDCYPIYNRFLPYLSPPSLAKFKSLTRLFCSADASCRQSGPMAADSGSRPVPR